MKEIKPLFGWKIWNRSRAGSFRVPTAEDDLVGGESASVREAACEKRADAAEAEVARLRAVLEAVLPIWTRQLDLVNRETSDSIQALAGQFSRMHTDIRSASDILQEASTTNSTRLAARRTRILRCKSVAWMA